MHVLKNLLDGYRAFYKTEYLQKPEKYKRLAAGQAPRIMVISCCDSRVNPTQVFNVEPGDIFTVRNVANLVPPFEEKGEYHGTSAALEFAVRELEVERIIVMGHSQCGGIGACLKACCEVDPEPNFINNWMSLARDAAQTVIHDYPEASQKELQAQTEKAAVASSLRNLETFPFIKSSIDKGNLKNFGAHFDIGTGVLEIRQPEDPVFRPVTVDVENESVFRTKG